MTGEAYIDEKVNGMTLFARGALWRALLDAGYWEAAEDTCSGLGSQINAAARYPLVVTTSSEGSINLRL